MDDENRSRTPRVLGAATDRGSVQDRRREGWDALTCFSTFSRRSRSCRWNLPPEGAAEDEDELGRRAMNGGLGPDPLADPNDVDDAPGNDNLVRGVCVVTYDNLVRGVCGDVVRRRVRMGSGKSGVG